MIGSLVRALGQSGDPAFRRVLGLGIAGAFATYALLALGVGLILWKTELFQTGWAEWSIDLLGGLAVLVLPLLLFPALVTVIVSLLLERIATAVEARHYPGLAPPRDQGLAEGIASALRFAVIALTLNIIALVFVYWIPGLNLIVFYALNGYLLGREYFELVAFRRLSSESAGKLRKTALGRVWLDGALIAFFLSIPLVNLAAPIVATAFMLHEFEALRRARGIVYEGKD